MIHIQVQNLFFMLIPIAIVWYFYWKWTRNTSEIAYATLRMVLQLIAIGYLLVYIFAQHSLWFGVLIVAIMVSISSWIALRHVKTKDLRVYFDFFVPIFVSGSFVLWIVMFLVLDLDYYEPKILIPIAGMIYANTMNAISLASERFEKELLKVDFELAREIAFKASMIPQINSFFAVGLVSLPGMMTGQILSGIDPLVAVRYQIVVMAMVLGSAGIGVIGYMLLQTKRNVVK